MRCGGGIATGLRPTLEGMTHLSLMLAARASAAVPGLTLVSTTDQSDESRYQALATDTESRAWVIELPRVDDEESHTRERIPALRAMGDGLRSRLPFGVPRIHGDANVKGRTLTVAEWLPGFRVSAAKVTPGLAGGLGEAMAGLHSIPASALYDQGRPINTANEAQRVAVGIVDRAAQTTLLPQSLLRRWEAAYEDPELWQFEPAIVHGSLRLDDFLTEGDRVTAITGWRSLHVGDPARDIAWVTAPTMKDIAQPIETAYRSAHSGADRRLFQRGRFWAELDIARWLLHGMDSGNEDVVRDATDLINQLHDRVGHDLDNALTEPITQTPHPLHRENPNDG
jgi:macrolide phosphotransferase